MRLNNGKGNNSERDEWETPQKLWDKLDKQYKFTTDCCASKENTKCKDWTNNFLAYSEKEGSHIHWMNPPFSIAGTMFAHFFQNIKKGVAIYRCDNFETGIWQEIIFPWADWIFIPNKRTEYKGLSNKWDRPVFASALIGVGVEHPKELEGTVLLISGE